MKRFVGKHALIIALTLFVCIALGVFAYLGLTGTPDGGRQWNPNVTYLPSTPTATLVPVDGWWTTISSPTPKSSTP